MKSALHRTLSTLAVVGALVATSGAVGAAAAAVNAKPLRAEIVQVVAKPLRAE
ncbi:hypothetical protein [Paractinoplanes brasiliensis]|uniref:Uncharacterized protein n=1 Tax=Paractinoplanes brasiliensis TaxID=52695 RepID=A0A4R6JBR7_9ACTN|nr:hypothetical protein [Actinoplanes brasiliensis]TDO32982.1 hypothetical protein C8E87_8462 [Actinoplanes brasiliensis]GID28701.1 hypothetical protein Abr02nite_36840 [Actinoplanes brasiliensis]